MNRWHFSLATALVLSTANLLHSAQVSVITIDGAIGPATAGYISRAIALATARGDECLIIQLDTPGGLLESTKHIVRSFYDSKIPTVVYVSPTGAIAGSAGTFITMAADVAAMAPHTSIGAAHPVSIGSSGEVEKVDDTMKKKIENATASMIENIADKRRRNAEWAKKAVLESEVIKADKALEMNVIDLVAEDLSDLLKQLDTRQVGGKTLHTAKATLARIPMNAWERFSNVLLRPEVMFIFMLLAIYGLIGEVSNPGAILPGVVGAISLILVLYMSAILPVNIAGFAFIALAVALFIIDVYSPSHGVLTAGGIVSFFLGALMLFNHAEPGFRLSLGYIIPGVAVTALFFLFVMGAGLRAQRLPVRAGTETMIGQIADVVKRTDATGGKVFVEGEYWNAVSDVAIEPGQPAEVVALNGLILKVKPKQT
jgi:membrane-bound serine protease (ClpP class)